MPKGIYTRKAKDAEIELNGAAEEMDINDVGKGESTSAVDKPPYTVEVTVQGVAAILFHRWDDAEVELKANAQKNSREKKTDNPESFVYRSEEGYLGITADVVLATLANAGRYKQDPRSPRKSARDLVKASLLITPEVPLLRPKTRDWDYIDRRRAVIRGSGITRSRPAMKPGWTIDFFVTVINASYCDKNFLHDIVTSAGKYVGFCDQRPQFGRFNVVSFKVVNAGLL